MKNVMVGALIFLTMWVLIMALPVIFTIALYMAIAALAIGTMFYVGKWALSLVKEEGDEETAPTDKEEAK